MIGEQIDIDGFLVKLRRPPPPSGITVLPHILAVSRESKYVVQKSLIQKRRRRYRVVHEIVDKPAAFLAFGNMLYVHPTIYERLKEATA